VRIAIKRRTGLAIAFVVMTGCGLATYEELGYMPPGSNLDGYSTGKIWNARFVPRTAICSQARGRPP
jgi:hypothetical protein